MENSHWVEWATHRESQALVRQPPCPPPPPHSTVTVDEWGSKLQGGSPENVLEISPRTTDMLERVPSQPPASDNLTRRLMTSVCPMLEVAQSWLQKRIKKELDPFTVVSYLFAVPNRAAHLEEFLGPSFLKPGVRSLTAPAPKGFFLTPRLNGRRRLNPCGALFPVRQDTKGFLFSATPTQVHLFGRPSPVPERCPPKVSFWKGWMALVVCLELVKRVPCSAKLTKLNQTGLKEYACYASSRFQPSTLRQLWLQLRHTRH